MLAPFPTPTLRAQRPRWRLLSAQRRVLVVCAGGGVVLPFVPMVLRVIQLGLADERFYGEIAAQQSFTQRLSDQIAYADEALRSPGLPVVLAVATLVLLAVTFVRGRIDWLSVGFVAVAVAFVLFAAESGVVASRYYLPPIVSHDARARTHLGEVPAPRVRRGRRHADRDRRLPGTRRAEVGAIVGRRRA